jgi:hypothetical protein
MTDKKDGVEEASVVAGIKGFQAPIGSKGKKKNNPSKPFGEDEISEGIYVEAEDEEIEERIEKRGDVWVVIDPRTGAQVDTAISRKDARDKQKQHGITQKRDPNKAGNAVSSTDKSRTVKHRKPQVSKKIENLKRMIRRVMKESNMISYMFDSTSPSVSLWESAIQKLPRHVVQSDAKLYEILEGIARAEAKTLARSVMEIKRVLEAAGPFLVERQAADQDPETGDVRMPFSVQIGKDDIEGGKKKLLFGVKLEGMKPCILFPETSRTELSEMLTNESRLLRAELMHVQETVLDKIAEVIEASSHRDMYLDEMHKRLHESVKGMNFVEAVVLKKLVREKLKGVKKNDKK